MVRAGTTGVQIRQVAELPAEASIDEGDEIEESINRRARNVALLISAGFMGLMILIALLLRQSTL